MWAEALVRTAEYGLIAVLFVVLLKYVLVKMDNRITNVDKSLGQINQSLAKWSTYIQNNSPLGVNNEQARKLIDISFMRDMFEIMDYISTELIFRAGDTNISQKILQDRLISKMDAVLNDTRDFLGRFRTSKGTIKEPLDNQLPLSEGLAGDEKGDQIFMNIVNKIVIYMRDNSMNNEEKLHEIKKLADQRREESRNFLICWLEGNNV